MKKLLNFKVRTSAKLLKIHSVGVKEELRQTLFRRSQGFKSSHLLTKLFHKIFLMCYVQFIFYKILKDH